MRFYIREDELDVTNRVSLENPTEKKRAAQDADGGVAIGAPPETGESSE
jgi:hypothetical protein